MSDSSDASADPRAAFTPPLLECLRVQSWTRMYPIVQRHLELLDDPAFERLAEMDANARSAEFVERVGAEAAQRAVHDVRLVHSILASCRSNGIVETFLQMTITIGTETANRLGALLER